MTEAEYMALTVAVREAIWLQGLMNDLGIEQDFLRVHCDNMSAIYLAKNHSIMRERSILMSGTTLYEMFLKTEISR